jgi:peptidoglycan/LPS O-acetylase OafA/YrhL
VSYDSFRDRPSRPLSSYQPLFDYLRFVLAAVVMMYHGGILTWHQSGNLAVQIFFALSGWLIGNILLTTPFHRLPDFYFNRALRIWGPYYVALGLLVAVSLLKDPVTPRWLEFVIQKATFTYNLFGPQQIQTHLQDMPLKGTGNHFWSVNAEEQFYLFAPLVLCIHRVELTHRLAAWLLLTVLAFKTHTYPAIFLGVLMAFVNQLWPEQIHHIRTKSISVAVIAGSIAALMVTDSLYGSVAPWFAMAAVMLLCRTGVQTPWGKILGGISYPLYLNHWIGVFAANALMSPFGWKGTVASQVLAMVLGLLIATVLYLAIDKPLLSRREQLRARINARIVVLIAYGLPVVGIAFTMLFFKASV